MLFRGHGLAEVAIVLDDAVVHGGQPRQAIDVWMGVGVRRPAVGGPSGVPDAQRSTGRIARHRHLQRRDLSRLLADVQTAIACGRDARGVVAPIFEASESRKNDRHRIPVADVANDSTHGAPASQAASAAVQSGWTAMLRRRRFTETTSRPFLGFIRTRIPSTSASGPRVMRTRCPSRRYGWGSIGSRDPATR